MKVAYFLDIEYRADVHGNYSIKESKSDLGSFSYLRESSSSSCLDRERKGEGHLMDPSRLRMVHSLILSLGLRNLFRVEQIRPCSDGDLRLFHSKNYIDFLAKVSHEKIISGEDITEDECLLYNIGPVSKDVDCTAFSGMFEFNRRVAGASLDAAHLIATGQADIAINWAGGFHHAKQSSAAGFCYINDCVLAIVQLLTSLDRVLYIDIDFHHGDGVEQAFYITDRVCTLSFHRFSPSGKVFPGSGDIGDTGAGLGAFHSINVPLVGGVSDEAFIGIFHPIVAALVIKFKPNAIVLQAGADSLTGDCVGMQNGSFSLSTRGHAQCVKIVRDLKIPLLVLGGGGYSKESVAKCWAIETAVLCGKEIHELPDLIPNNDFYFSSYAEKNLHVEPKKDSVDFNSPGRLNLIKEQVLNNIDKMIIFNGTTLAPNQGKKFRTDTIS